MGVSTKAIIRKGTTLKEISDVLSEKYKEVQIISTHSVEYFIITFLDGDKRRGLNVFTYNTEDEDIDGVRLSLGMWGDSVEIMKYILNVFGGYIDENDCDDEGYYSVNI